MNALVIVGTSLLIILFPWVCAKSSYIAFPNQIYLETPPKPEGEIDTGQSIRNVSKLAGKVRLSISFKPQLEHLNLPTN